MLQPPITAAVAAPLAAHETWPHGAYLDVGLSYLGAFLVMIASVIIIYARRGVVVVLRILAYLSSLATVAISLKVVYTRHGFDYPQYLSFVHFVCTLLVAFVLLVYERVQLQQKSKMPSLQQFTCEILPISATFAVSVGISNLALVYANVGFVEMIGCSTPVCVVFVSTCLGYKFDPRLILPVLVACVGIAMCTRGEIKYSIYGFLLAFGACVLRAVKTTLQGCLLSTPDLGPKDHKTALSPVELLIWTSLPSTAIMFVWSLLAEGMEPQRLVMKADAFRLRCDIGCSCLLACLVNVLGLYMMRDIGVLGSQLAGQLKSILSVMGSVALLGEAVGPLQIWGFVCILVGVFWHNRIEERLGQSRAKQAGSLPTVEERRHSDERAPLLTTQSQYNTEGSRPPQRQANLSRSGAV